MHVVFGVNTVYVLYPWVNCLISILTSDQADQHANCNSRKDGQACVPNIGHCVQWKRIISEKGGNNSVQTTEKRKQETHMSILQLASIL